MLNLIFLQAATTADGQQGNQWSFWIMMILIFVVFYFFMIRPQTKRQKELQKQSNQYTNGIHTTKEENFVSGMVIMIM